MVSDCMTHFPLPYLTTIHNNRGNHMTVTENKQHYICYVPKCSKCGQWGNLHSLMVRQGTKWFGPYYEIRHMRKEYSQEKYLALRESGLTSAQAHNQNRFISRKTYYCYFGKICPIQLPLIKVHFHSPRGRKVGSRLQEKRLLAAEARSKAR